MKLFICKWAEDFEIKQIKKTQTFKIVIKLELIILFSGLHIKFFKKEKVSESLRPSWHHYMLQGKPFILFQE